MMLPQEFLIEVSTHGERGGMAPAHELCRFDTLVR